MSVINAFFGGSKHYRTAHRYQWDKGQVLVFHDVPLPTAYRVDFSTDPLSGTAVSMLGGEDGVQIPDSLLEQGKNIYAWVVVSDGDGERTVYVAEIPVRRRPKPQDAEPTEQEKSIIQQAIEALNKASNIYVDDDDYLRFGGGE